MQKRDNLIYRESGIAPLFLVLVLAGLFALGFGAWYVGQKWKTPEPVFCTADAKQCPDGSYVGRTGPKCEFASCPSEALCEGGQCPNTPTLTDTINRIGASSTLDTSSLALSSVEGWKTYRNEQYGFEFKYPFTFSVNEWGTNLPEDVINGERLPSGTQFPYVVAVDINHGEKDIFEIDIFGNKKNTPSQWSDFGNYPSPVSGDYDWSLRPCGQEGFNLIKSKQKIIFADHKTLYVTSVADFGKPENWNTWNFYCINYPQNPIIIEFDETNKTVMDQILSTFKFIK